MKIKAELIQASNNLSAGTPIYTFRLTYPRKSWLDTIGLSKYFEQRLTQSYVVTDTYVRGLMRRARGEAKRDVHCALTDQINEVVAFAEKIFRATNPNNYGAAKRVTGADVQKAIDLFGPRLQEVLKQYKPGEMHAPFGEETYENRYYYEHGHAFLATKDGWQRAS